MIETFTIVTLSILALIFFRPGKTEPLKSPLVINRGGQFHAVLAPMINLAQPLLENISRQLGEQERQSGNSQPLYFKVNDKEVKAHGKDFYLLAATLRDGVLYFQAAAPEDKGSDLDTIRAFSEAELTRHPATAAISEAAQAALSDAIQSAASQRGSTLTLLTQ
ncbi:MAG: hypothetical protein GC139_04985 [Sideroxydans sp.]|nr:hypothetical protein [Sideroxydans sp.]